MVSENTIFKRDKIELYILLVPNTQKTEWTGKVFFTLFLCFKFKL